MEKTLKQNTIDRLAEAVDYWFHCENKTKTRETLENEYNAGAAFDEVARLEKWLDLNFPNDQELLNAKRKIFKMDE